MRLYVSFLLLALFVIITYALPVTDEETAQIEAQAQSQAEALLAVDAQGHENESDRIARQFGFGRYGGYGYGGYGGYRGGYGGYRGGYGGYRGGYGGGYRRGGYGYYG